MNDKTMISTKINSAIYQELRKLCYETGLHQYQVLEEGIKYLAEKHREGKLQVVKETST